MEKMETIVSLAALLGVGYGLFRGMKWMMQAGLVQTAKNPPLSPNDLKVLEESAERLMADLRLVTDECVARIEQALAHARTCIGHLEGRAVWPPPTVERPIPSLDTTEPPAYSGMMTGEIELIKGLRAIAKKGTGRAEG